MNVQRSPLNSVGPGRMVDLSPQNRLTLKRNNMLLQKQLDVQVRIMTEEYRMTKKDLEKNCKDIGGFLMYLHHTAPGLGSYGQPDTRAMNAKNMIKYKMTGPSDDDKKKAAKLMEKLKAGEFKSADEENETSNKSKEESRPPSRRNEFFNKRIVLDSKRRSFLQNSMIKDSGGKPPSSGDPRDDLRRAWATPVNRGGFLSNRDTQGEASSSKKRPQTCPQSNQRPRTARYGSDAYSEHDDIVRKEILGRFNFIFDPQNVKPEGRLRRQGLAATPIALPKTTGNDDSPQTQNDPSSLSSPPTYILNRRVAWSAPPKRREAPPTDPNSNIHQQHQPNRQAMSVTPRSGTARLSIHRCSSASTSLNPEMRKASMIETPAEVKQIIDSQMQKRNPQRPKTAPPNYQLMQRNVAAPRQQVAGILAEIQSRTADTRAMLLKSKQLKKMVKSLAPEDEDDVSD